VSSTDADVRILLTAEDQASETVRDAARRINTEFRDWRRENQALERSMILNNKTFFETAQTISRVGNVAQRGLNIWQSYNIQQLRISDSTRNVRDAQKELNEAYLTGDPAAVAEATERLADANRDLEQAQLQSNIAMIGFAFAIPGLIADVIRLIPQIRSLGVAYGLLGRNAKIATGATALTGALGGLTAGGGGLAGAAAGGIGGKIKAFAGSTAGRVILPLAAGVGTYEFLTETQEGRAINEYNPFKLLADAVFMATHSSEEVARARAGQTVNVYGASTSETIDYISQTTQEGTVYE
jgi:hypothetical protein